MGFTVPGFVEEPKVKPLPPPEKTSDFTVGFVVTIFGIMGLIGVEWMAYFSPIFVILSLISFIAYTVIRIKSIQSFKSVELVTVVSSPKILEEPKPQDYQPYSWMEDYELHKESKT
jgi:hypothetical protein